MTKKHLPYLLLAAFIFFIGLIFIASSKTKLPQTETTQTPLGTNPNVASDLPESSPSLGQNDSIGSKQDTENRPVKLTISPTTQTIAKGKTTTFEASLSSQEPIALNIAGIDITFDPTQVQLTGSRCGETFSSIARNEITDTALFLSCFKSPGTGRTNLEPNQKLVIGSFDLNPKKAGNFTLTVTRIAVPASGGYNASDPTAAFSFPVY